MIKTWTYDLDNLELGLHEGCKFRGPERVFS